MTPRLQHAPSMIRTPDHEKYVLDHAAFARARGEKTIHRADAVRLYVSEGRWVADCAYCAAGMTGHPDWPDVRCFGCSAIYVNVTWPGEIIDIEDELIERKRVQQNWRLNESVATLARENVDHGLPSPFIKARLAAVGVIDHEEG